MANLKDPEKASEATADEQTEILLPVPAKKLTIWNAAMCVGVASLTDDEMARNARLRRLPLSPLSMTAC